ncbi:MAG: glycosyltransferase family 2 protein [Bacteroidia bacterium]
MKISIIIVNYNVQYFLEQCLYSVRKASENIEAEIFVVDNHSVDGSVAIVKEKFPEVILIENKENTGFSKANNQAILRATGNYILLLNPDTLVEEDTFRKIIFFMDEHPEAGGLGVKMLDGKGNFLSESKRGLPTPWVAFYKIFGFSQVFPKSKKFGKYHLGFLDKDKTHEVDILSGAFMLLRKSVLDTIGLLDESFFMYGEDIDISYRIKLGGFKNYYFPETRIIHYKGESTKKSSVNYVFVFYNAMIIFAKKHFSKKNANLFSTLINMAVYLRASVALLMRFLRKISVPFFDALILFGGLFLLKKIYAEWIKFPDGGTYPALVITRILPLYIFIWLSAIFVSGGYDYPIKIKKIIRGILLGSAGILIVYALLPEYYRFSRAIILLGTVWAIVGLVSERFILHLLKIKNFELNSTEKKRVLIVGEQLECERVHALIKQMEIHPKFISYVAPDGYPYDQKNNFSGSINQLKEIIEIYRIDEIIFCAKDLSAQRIMDQMSQPMNADIEYKIAPPESLSVIGSNSIHASGELYVIDINSIAKSANKRNKRLLDFLISLCFIITLPLNIFIVKNKKGFLKNIFSVLFGKLSFVGYTSNTSVQEKNKLKLPEIKNGILNPTDVLSKKNISEQMLNDMNILYAKDYKPFSDIIIIWKNFKKLGRSFN